MIRNRHIVSDTGPLISLEKLYRGYEFIRLLYAQLIVPPAVLAEVTEGQFENPQAYFRHYNLDDFVVVRSVTRYANLPEADRLHAGEIQAIQLALDLQLPLLIEETVGRRVAQHAGLSISGIAGQIVTAWQEEIISAAEASDKLGELLQTGRINRKIYGVLIAHIYKA